MAKNHPAKPAGPLGVGPRARIRLRLYVAGNAPNSVRAIANCRAICDEHFASAHEIEIVDCLEHPKRALSDGIIVTPTLLKLLPLPVQRVIGSLNDTDQVLMALSQR
ncbi:MAG: circadian clock KaiB family protein [Acidobacteriota bacterium]